ncbi:MAG: copper resistance protein CopC [Chloroflexota bacterium]|nr:copper resistance protein CopC [Chloroflexota bacterium]
MQRPLQIGLLVLAVTLGSQAIALADVALVKSTPAAGSTVAGRPATVELIFNEAIDTRSTGKVNGPDGALVSSAARVNSTIMVIPVTAGGDGTYTVTYTSIDAADGHAIDGSFMFRVATASATPTTAAPTVQVSSTAPGTPAPTVAAQQSPLLVLVPVGLAVAVIAALLVLRARRRA